MIPRITQATSIKNISKQPQTTNLKNKKSANNLKNNYIPKFIQTKSSLMAHSLHQNLFKTQQHQKIDINQMKSIFHSPVSQNNHHKPNREFVQSEQNLPFRNLLKSKDHSNRSNSKQIIPKMKMSISKYSNKIKAQQRGIYQSKTIFCQEKNYFCKNHSDKIALFQSTFGSQPCYYCQNCAKELKNERFHISEILKSKDKFKFSAINLNNPQDNLRQKLFSSRNKKFMPKIDLLNCQKQKQSCIKKFFQVLKISKEKHEKIIEQCSKIESYYFSQIKKIDNLYLTLIQDLKSYRHNHIRGLQIQCNALISYYQNQINTLKKSIKNFNQLQQQIKRKFIDSSNQRESNIKNSLRYYYHTVQILDLKAQKAQNSLKKFPKYNIQNFEKNISEIIEKIQEIANETCLKPITKSFNIKMKNLRDLHDRKTIGNAERGKMWGIIHSSEKNNEQQEKNKNISKKQWRQVINKDQMYNFPNHQSQLSSIRSSNKVFNSIIIPQNEGFETKLRKCFSNQQLNNNKEYFMQNKDLEQIELFYFQQKNNQ